MSEFSQLLAVRVLELEATEKRDKAILEGGVVNVVTKKWERRTFSASFAPSHEMMKRAQRSRGRPHIEEVLGVL